MGRGRTGNLKIPDAQKNELFLKTLRDSAIPILLSLPALLCYCAPLLIT